MDYSRSPCHLSMSASAAAGGMPRSFRRAPRLGSSRAGRTAFSKTTLMSSFRTISPTIRLLFGWWSRSEVLGLDAVWRGALECLRMCSRELLQYGCVSTRCLQLNAMYTRSTLGQAGDDSKRTPSMALSSGLALSTPFWSVVMYLASSPGLT